MTAPLRVRTARTEDVPSIAAMNAALALETEGKRLSASVLRRGAARAVRARALGRFFVAERDDAVVGQALLTYELSDWSDGITAWFQSVYVRPDARRHGVFRALFDHVIAFAARNPDIRAVRLHVDRDNRTAKAVYRRLGFAPDSYEVLTLRAGRSSSGGSRSSRGRGRSA
ncbi:MAG: GNAT family N-acetyltransferase [Polyangiaceae bacterium]